MERTKHYREWLASQNYLDSLCKADICKMGKSNIPSRNKKAEYSNIPKYWCSTKVKKLKVKQQNAMPGPSCQKGRKDKDLNRDHPKGQKDDHPKKSAPPHDKRGMGGGPSEPSGSNDSTSNSTFSTPTETSTDTESSDSSVEEPPEINRNRRSQSRRVSSRRSTGGNERHRDK